MFGRSVRSSGSLTGVCPDAVKPKRRRNRAVVARKRPLFIGWPTLLFRASSEGLYVDDHVSNPVELLPDQKPGSGGEVVRILNRHFGIYFEMKFDVVLQPGLSGIDFLHPGDARCAECNPPDVF